MSTLKEMTDEQLALLYIDGNNKAFDELLVRIQDKIFSYVMYLTKDEDMANDVFQDTFVKAIIKMKNGQYKDSGKFVFWMMRIAHNIFIDHYRDQKGEHVIELTKGNNLQNLRVTNRENEMVNEQVREDVTKLMNALPETQREVAFMRFFQDMSFKEIAEETGVSINTSLGRMRYALINMRRMSQKNNMNLTMEL